MTKNKSKKEELAIKVEDVSKVFRIPHEKHTSLKSAALNVFEKKTYEEFTALKNVSFEVKKGEFFGIIGRNGSGKSTLLKILAGIYVADKGKVEINGKLSPFLELGVGFNPELTGRENIFLGGSILGLSRKEVAEKFEKIVDFSEIREFIDMKMKNYSSGMQVRLAFSLAINVYAEILLMDEVLAVGDTNFQSKCLTEFNRYKKQGKTVVLVTHDISTVQKYCDRAILLRKGKIAKIGKAEEVGDAYTYQNMSDEEKRLHNEQKRVKGADLNTSKEEDISSQKIAEIRKLELFDRNGKKKNTFETGDALEMKVYFKLYNEKKGINIGIGLYSETNERVFSYNTLMDNFKIKKGDSSITLHFEKTPILKGNYYFNVAIFDEEEKIYYDIKKGFKRIKMFSTGSKNNYRGLFDVKHEWRAEE